MITKFEGQGDRYKILVMAILLVMCCFLTYYFHAVLGSGTVFTHFFYIPIILASLWWKRKGLVVALFVFVPIVSKNFILICIKNCITAGEIKGRHSLVGLLLRNRFKIEGVWNHET